MSRVTKTMIQSRVIDRRTKESFTALKRSIFAGLRKSAKMNGHLRLSNFCAGKMEDDGFVLDWSANCHTCGNWMSVHFECGDEKNEIHIAGQCISCECEPKKIR